MKVGVKFFFFKGKMRYLLAVVFCLGTLLAVASAGNDYQWGEIGPDDILLAKDLVTKTFVVGLTVSKKYVFKQKVSRKASKVSKCM